MVKQSVFPRWRGFHLLNMITVESWETNVQDQIVSPFVFQEKDFQLISEWGFNFVRIPISYRCLIQDMDYYKLREDRLMQVDAAVRYGLKWGLHVNLSFHRAPGYCILDGGLCPEPDEELDLWEDREAQEIFGFYWKEFAARYKGIDPECLSFNLVNEPSHVSEEKYASLCREIIDQIHGIDPQRPVIVDGYDVGNRPVVSLCDMAKEHVGQACRGYYPQGIVHHGLAPYLDKSNPPTWPYRAVNPVTGVEESWGKEDMDAYFKEWATVADQYQTGVICGEFGCYCHTPHKVVLSWMEDLLQTLAKYNIGYTVWNLRGEFGVLNSERRDVEYEDFRGEKLDRKMLELLQKY